MNIKSLKKINEGWQYVKDPHEQQYDKDVTKAHDAFEKTRSENASWNPFKFLSPSHNRLAGEAKADRDMALQQAEDRYKAAKSGMISKHDYDEAKYQAAVAKRAAANKAAAASSQTSDHVDDKPGMFRKIGQHLSDHGLAYGAAGVATLAGLAALQKRKNRLPEPGKY